MMSANAFELKSVTPKVFTGVVKVCAHQPLLTAIKTLVALHDAAKPLLLVCKFPFELLLLVVIVP
jgi:hypothetical protein